MLFPNWSKIWPAWYKWWAQRAALIHYVAVFIMLPIACLWVPPYMLLFTRLWPLCLLYFAWYCYDRQSPKRGAYECRLSRVVQTMPIWKHFRDYFPLELIKTVDLPPDRNYLFGLHPHGVMSMAAFCNFCTEANDRSKLFPGLKFFKLTLAGQFWFPLRREYGLLYGGCEASRESIEHLLSGGRGHAGVAVCLVVGGAREALAARPRCRSLVLRQRKGFVRLAIQHGASLVPVYTFGENELYNQLPVPHGSTIYAVQAWLKRHAGFAPPSFFGRGIIAPIGMLPRQWPLVTVVGRPIDVERTAEPSKQMVDSYHERYVNALVDLFDSFKAACGYPHDQLNIE